MKIAITALSFSKYDKTPLVLLEQAGIEYIINDTGKTLNEEESIQIMDGCIGIIPGYEPLNKKILDACPYLKVISCCSKNIDNIDDTYVQEKKITTFYTYKGYATAVAEFTIGLMLSLLRNIPQQDKDIRSGVWRKRIGSLLQEKHVGIIGFGYVGSTLAELLLNFGVKICYNDPNVHTDKFQKLELDNLIKCSDIITLHCSATEKKPLLDLGRLSLMHPGCYLINVAQGNLIDEKALFGLLTAGHLSGVALDVYNKEPYEGFLNNIDNVILTPRIGSHAKEAKITMEINAVKNIINFLKPPLNTK